MGLTGTLLRAAAQRPHVLVVAMPGETATRVAVEAEIRRRGWPVAATPADTDVLLVAGAVVPALTDMLEETWRAVSAPRSRVQAVTAGDVGAALDSAQLELTDVVLQRAAATAAAPSGARPVQQHQADAARHHEYEQPAETSGGGHGSHGSHDGSHGGHEMAGMDMPAGLAMANRGEDRDGLKLDQLHLSLGPVLPDWPTGLVLHLVLQGDVVQKATIEALTGAEGESSFWNAPWHRAAAGEAVAAGEAARRRVAAHLDSLSRLLAVAGWSAAATGAQRLRDDTLDGVSQARLVPVLERFGRQVTRSRTLRWMTRDLGRLVPDDTFSGRHAIASGVRGPARRAAGDVTARYRQWCLELVDTARLLDDDGPLDANTMEPPRGLLDDGSAPSAELLAVLPGLLVGTEFAAARLIVASLDPDLDELRTASMMVAHGS